MNYELLCLITNQIYFNDISSMISMKCLCKMSYDIFITNIQRHEIVCKLSKKFNDYGLDDFELIKEITDSKMLTEVLKDISNVLLDNCYYTQNKYNNFKLIDFNYLQINYLQFIFHSDKLSPFKHLKFKSILHIKRRSEKSLIFNMAMDHYIYKRKSYVYYEIL